MHRRTHARLRSVTLWAAVVASSACAHAATKIVWDSTDVVESRMTNYK